MGSRWICCAGPVAWTIDLLSLRLRDYFLRCHFEDSVFLNIFGTFAEMKPRIYPEFNFSPEETLPRVVNHTKLNYHLLRPETESILPLFKLNNNVYVVLRL